jgi:hypothetical protein
MEGYSVTVERVRRRLHQAIRKYRFRDVYDGIRVMIEAHSKRAA